MNISYDIFDVADFPIVLTDSNFIIIYKNRLAAKLFGTLRKRSKITRHIRNFKSDIDLSDINELNIETGTQFTRALVLHLGENLFVFSFLSIYAFTSKLELAEHIKSSFGGDFMSFFCTAYKEYAKFESMSKTERANVPERAFPELAKILPEFSFEFSLLQKLGFFDNSLYFTLENSVLKLRYRIKCATGSDFLFRSEPQEIRRRRLDKIIGELLRKTKLLLSKK